MLCLSLTNREAEEPWGNPAVKDRGRGSRSYTLTSTFDLADILTLAPEESLCKYVGSIDGYPTACQIERHVEKARTHFAIFVYPLVPAWQTETWEDGPRLSLHLEITLQAGKVQKSFQQVFNNNLPWGYSNFFKETWDKIVHEGSAYFPDGQIKIGVGVKQSARGQEVTLADIKGEPSMEGCWGSYCQERREISTYTVTSKRYMYIPVIRPVD